MPYLSITSNVELATAAGQLEQLSKTVADGLGKPESYVMVSLHHNPAMLFAGNTQPLAFCELKSLGLLENQTTDLSHKLCSCIQQLYAIETSRIYIEFSAPARSMWGWDNKTF